MHAYLINLPDAEKRREAAIKELEKCDIDYTIVEAIYGRDLDFPIKEYSNLGYRLKQGRRRIDAEVGCYLSHLKAIQCFWDSGENYGLILEDDVQFVENLGSLLSKAIQYGKFDLLRLSSVNSGLWTKTMHLENDYYIGVAFRREKGAGAYVVSREGAARILNNYLPMDLPYDHRFDLEWKDRMTTLGVSPPPVAQKGFSSQIQNNIRSYYYPSYVRYWTVLPCRFLWEISRFVARSVTLIKLKYRTREWTQPPNGDESS